MPYKSRDEWSVSPSLPALCAPWPRIVEIVQLTVHKLIGPIIRYQRNSLKIRSLGGLRFLRAARSSPRRFSRREISLRMPGRKWSGVRSE